MEIAHKLQLVSIRLVAKTLGKLACLKLSHGPIINEMSRALQHIIGRTAFEKGWQAYCILTQDAAIEIKFLLDNLFNFNGYGIFNTLSPVFILDEKFIVEFPELEMPKEFLKIASDASDRKSFVYNIDSQFSLVEDFVFSKTEAKLGSGLRELLSVKKSLESRPEYFANKKGLVLWLTDSQNCFSFLLRGSNLPHIQTVARDIKILEFNLGIKIQPVWVPRTNPLLVLADLGSKFDKSTDEWSIDLFSFKKIQNYFQVTFTFDAFASNENRRTQKYFSKIPQLFSCGINFFAQKLDSQEIYFICPPTKMICSVIDHVLKFDVRGVLFIPVWRSSDFWLKIIRNLKLLHIFHDYLVLSPQFFANNEASNMFTGKKNFYSLALYFDTSKVSGIMLPEFLIKD